VRRHAAWLLAASLTVGAACGTDDPDPEPAAGGTCRPAPLREGELVLDVENLAADSHDGSIDTDGDRRDDEVAVTDDGGLRITRGDGELHFPGAGLQTGGDLDGDGRDDLILHKDDRSFAVHGRTGPGTYDVLEIGVALAEHLTYIWRDDLDGRDGFDLAAPERIADRPRTRVYSGAEVLELGPGGDAGDLEPARTLPGLPRAVVALQEGAEPETVLLVPGERTSLRFAERPDVELRTEHRASRVEDLKVFDEEGGRRIALVVDRHVAVWAAPPRCR
jgi:hypothetical protein